MKHASIALVLAITSSCVDQYDQPDVDQAQASDDTRSQQTVRVFYPRILINLGTWEETTVRLVIDTGNSEDDLYTVAVPCIATRHDVVANHVIVEIPRITGERLVGLSYEALGNPAVGGESEVRAELIHSPTTMTDVSEDSIRSAIVDRNRPGNAWGVVKMPTFAPIPISSSGQTYMQYTAIKAGYKVGQITATYDKIGTR